MITLRSSKYTSTEYKCLNNMVLYGYLTHYTECCKNCSEKGTCKALREMQYFIRHIQEKNGN